MVSLMGMGVVGLIGNIVCWIEMCGVSCGGLFLFVLNCVSYLFELNDIIVCDCVSLKWFFCFMFLSVWFRFCMEFFCFRFFCMVVIIMLGFCCCVCCLVGGVFILVEWNS